MTFKALLATKTDKTNSTRVSLDQVPAVVNRMFEGKVQGRVVVDINA